jgi:16S rRNA (cytosine1402-N4)-methyltransferase
MMQAAFHEPVLLHEALRFLLTDPAGTYLDATAGGGGHATALAQKLVTGGRLVCLDADDEALRATRAALAGMDADVRQANFRDLRRELSVLGIPRISGALFDLGVSSRQLDDAARGFSFRADEPLDMRMDRRQELSGGDVINSYDEERLADVLFHYGEERRSRRIARAIVRARPVETTGGLRAAVAAVVGGGPFLVKSLARVFQAVRIEVNGELDALAQALRDATDVLQPGGRLVVISYHSLEDRIVKEWFRKESVAVPLGPVPARAMSVPRLRTLTRKPVTPEASEERENPRSRSAKLRAAERLPAEQP